MKPTFNLSDIKANIANSIQPPSTYTLRSLLKKHIDMDVYLESYGKNLQRDYVWTLEQKQNLIISFIRRDEIQPLLAVFNDLTNPNTFKIIDGKQRLSTLISYVNNAFPIIVKGNEYYYSDLDNDMQLNITTSTSIKIRVVYEWDSNKSGKITDEQLIELFEYANFLSTPQDLDHIKKIKQK
jgi:uncharacterized protein with ParB-like and HNH nuclease domain